MSLKLTWTTPTAIPELKVGEVHIWSMSLALTEAQRTKLWDWLNEDERAKAARFRLDIHRERYIASQGQLREILSHYVQVMPNQIQFRFNPHGKPYFKLPEVDLFFNLSHSEDLAICAVMLHEEIGIDLEKIKERDASLDIAQRYFAETEWEALKNLSSEAQLSVFYELWTAKEAVVKAMGQGLYYALSNVVIGIEGAEPRLIRLDDIPLTDGSKLKVLIPAEGYTGTLAVMGNFQHASTWHWSLS